MSMLQWIHKQFVVLWDQKEQRGWLVNGTSALLHLVQASLHYSSTDGCESNFLFKHEDMHEANVANRPESSLKVLMEQKNWRLPLYPDKAGSPFCFQDLVVELSGIIAKMVDYQVQPEQDGIKLKVSLVSPRKYLEGWQFKDLITPRDPIYPCVMAVARPTGKSWIDLVEDVNAVILFGENFGEILSPSDDTNICSHWETLPKHKHYLAASTSDLKDIVNFEEYTKTSPQQLSRRIAWHHSGRPMGPHHCTGMTDSCTTHADRVQVLLPVKYTKFREFRGALTDLEDSGALVFGFNYAARRFRRDTRPCERGDPSIPTEGPGAAQSGDSEPGTSLDSSGPSISNVPSSSDIQSATSQTSQTGPEAGSVHAVQSQSSGMDAESRPAEEVQPQTSTEARRVIALPTDRVVGGVPQSSARAQKGGLVSRLKAKATSLKAFGKMRASPSNVV